MPRPRKETREMRAYKPHVTSEVRRVFRVRTSPECGHVFDVEHAYDDASWNMLSAAGRWFDEDSDSDFERFEKLRRRLARYLRWLDERNGVRHG